MSLIELQSSSYCGHSADVKISLFVNGRSIPVAQLGPGFVLLDETINHPPANATVMMRVDQSERRWNVRLPEGIAAGCKRVAIVAQRET